MNQSKSNNLIKCAKCGCLLPLSDFRIKFNGQRAKCCEGCLSHRASKKVKVAALTNRKCERCKEMKPSTKFKMGVTGRPRKICDDCLWYLDRKKKKTGIYAPESPGTTPFIPDIDVNKPIDLSFLNDLGGFSENEIKRLLLTVEVYSKDPHFMNPFAIYAKFFPHRKPKLCKQLVQEFTDVYRAGLEFDAYMKTNRKFRKDGKRLLAEGKK